MVNIQIARVFIKMRKLLETQSMIMEKLEELNKKDLEQDRQIRLIFEYFRQLEQARQDEQAFKERKQIGFRLGEND